MSYPRVRELLAYSGIGFQSESKMFSFKSRKVQQDLQQFLLRVINQNSRARAMVPDNRRIESRTHVSLGVWIIPVVADSPDVDAAFTAITEDFSTAGCAVMTNQPLAAEEVLICLPSESSSRLVRATVCSCKGLGCGWVLYNLKAVELLDEDKYSELRQLDESPVA